MKKLREWLVALFEKIFGGGGPYFPEFTTEIKDLIGYGPSYLWIHMSSSEIVEFADLLVENNNTVTHAEGLSYAELGYYENQDVALDKLMPYAREILSRNITFAWTYLNWNSQNICNLLNFEMAKHAIHRFLDEVGAEGVMFCPVSEWGPGCRNQQCWRLAQQICDYAAKVWPGMLLWNRGARPTSAPAPHRIEYHPQGVHDTGPENSIIVTDCTSILNQFGGLNSYFNPQKVQAYAQKCHDAGRGIIIYDFGNPQTYGVVDTGVVQALGGLT